MMRLLTGTAALAVLAACVYSNSANMLASAEPLSNPPDLAGIEELDTSAGLTVIYTVSDTYSIDVEVRRGDIEDVRIEREGDTLEVGRVHRNGWNWGNNLSATVTISGPNLEGVESSSGSSARVSGIAADEFDIEASSGASVTVSGTCSELSVEISSGASVSAEDLICEDGEVDGSSGASADLYLTGTVDIDVSSGASVDVEGGARIGEAEKSSGGSYSVSPAPL